MNARWRPVLVLIVAMSSPGCFPGGELDPCEEVPCSHHGTCSLDSAGGPVCRCDPDYVQVGLQCLLCPDDPPDLDGDGYVSARCGGPDCDDHDPSIPSCAERECGANGCGGVCESRCTEQRPWCNEVHGRCVGPGEWVSVRAGTFQMGSPPGEAGREPDGVASASDETQHAVTLTHDFEILSTEVTQDEYETLMGVNPSVSVVSPDHPVELVTWNDAASYCNALSVEAGLTPCYGCELDEDGLCCGLSEDFWTPYECPGYRLPTEAEWEYAARAGTVTATYAGDLAEDLLGCESPQPVLDGIAWFCGNSGVQLHQVGTRRANAWALQDLLGNALEWCHDCGGRYLPGSQSDPWGAMDEDGRCSTRMLRGGSAGLPATYARAAYRVGTLPFVKVPHAGFRPARTLDPIGE